MTLTYLLKYISNYTIKREPEANTPDSFHIRPIRQGGLISESGEYGKSERNYPNREKFCSHYFVIQKYHIKATQDDNFVIRCFDFPKIHSFQCARRYGTM